MRINSRRRVIPRKVIPLAGGPLTASPSSTCPLAKPSDTGSRGGGTGGGGGREGQTLQAGSYHPLKARSPPSPSLPPLAPRQMEGPPPPHPTPRTRVGSQGRAGRVGDGAVQQSSRKQRPRQLGADVGHGLKGAGWGGAGRGGGGGGRGVRCGWGEAVQEGGVDGGAVRDSLMRTEQQTPPAAPPARSPGRKTTAAGAPLAPPKPFGMSQVLGMGQVLWQRRSNKKGLTWIKAKFPESMRETVTAQLSWQPLTWPMP